MLQRLRCRVSSSGVLKLQTVLGSEPDNLSEENAQVCIANIGPKARQVRLQFGLVQLGMGLAVLVALLAIGAPWYWRAPLLLVFWGAASGFFQWRDKT